MTNDEIFMSEAIRLAEMGRGLVEPNPLVGAVVVRDNKIIGRGYHEAFGERHAEVNAINDAGAECSGAELYVTLEPCSHFGKTPPCVEAIKEAGIKLVSFAMYDPNPVTSKVGAGLLRKAGIEVREGALGSDAARLNAPFIKLMGRKLPYVTAKWAMTLDGKIATHTGDSRWISSPESRAYAHGIRGNMDAIMIGIGTAIADDPLLTCRVDARRIATRIIVDNNAALPLNSQLINTIKDAGVIVATTPNASADKVDRLRDCGCDIIIVNTTNGLVGLRQLLEELGRRQYTNILVEGGSRILGSLFDDNLIDKALIFVAPKIIGDKDAISPVSGEGLASISQTIQIDDIKVTQFERDIAIEGSVRKRQTPSAST